MRVGITYHHLIDALYRLVIVEYLKMDSKEHQRPKRDGTSLLLILIRTIIMHDLATVMCIIWEVSGT